MQRSSIFSRYLHCASSGAFALIIATSPLLGACELAAETSRTPGTRSNGKDGKSNPPPGEANDGINRVGLVREVLDPLRGSSPIAHFAQITVEAWVRPNGAEGSNARIIEKGGAYAGGGYGFELNAAAPGQLAFIVWHQIGTHDNAAVFFPDLPNQAWTHLLGTFDGTTVRLYVNGGFVGEKAVAAGKGIGTNSSNLFIGKGADTQSDANIFTGEIGRVRIYNRPLSIAEIQANCAAEIENFAGATCGLSK